MGAEDEKLTRTEDGFSSLIRRPVFEGPGSAVSEEEEQPEKKKKKISSASEVIEESEEIEEEKEENDSEEEEGEGKPNKEESSEKEELEAEESGEEESSEPEVKEQIRSLQKNQRDISKNLKGIASMMKTFFEQGFDKKRQQEELKPEDFKVESVDPKTMTEMFKQIRSLDAEDPDYDSKAAALWAPVMAKAQISPKTIIDIFNSVLDSREKRVQTRELEEAENQAKLDEAFEAARDEGLKLDDVKDEKGKRRPSPDRILFERVLYSTQASTLEDQIEKAIAETKRIKAEFAKSREISREKGEKARRDREPMGKGSNSRRRETDEETLARAPRSMNEIQESISKARRI